MKARKCWLLLVCVLLSSCAPANTQLPMTIPPTTAFRETVLPGVTPTPTSVLSITTASTLTLSPEQYPKLADVALTIDDIKIDGNWTDFTTYFFGPDFYPPEKRNRPIVKDITESIISARDCFLDCSGTLWSLTGRSVSIYIVRYESGEDAQLASEIFCLDIYEQQNHKVDSIDDCTGNYFEPSQAPTLDTWVAPYFSQDILAATYGPILVKVVLYFPGRWDEYTTKPNILLDVATLQVEKLKQAGFPATP